MCGIIGIVGRDTDHVAPDLYEGLHMLQHRGQDAAGLMTFDGRQFHSKRGPGLVRDVVRTADMQRLTGFAGLGHCRYPTAGSFDAAEAQPFYVNSPFGLSIVHNGNLTQIDKLRTDLNQNNIRHLNTSSDSEMLLNVFADELGKQHMKKIVLRKLWDAVGKTMSRISGGYAVIILIAGQGMLAFRDAHGLRPLTVGRQGDTVMFASENVAAVGLDFETVGDVAPGEAVFVPFATGKIHRHQCQKPDWKSCLFEFVYLARPDSVIDGISVYKARLRAGEYLADDIAAAKLDIDVVVPVPDSGRTAALTIADKLGVSYREGLMKNRYVGRTFIMPDQETRKKSIKRKLIPMELEFRGKNVLLVDDSIVRGNTSKQIIQMVRDCGAKKVYLASASPAVRYPDVYGIDMPTSGELVAHDKTEEQVRQYIQADKLFYLKQEDLVRACLFERKSPVTGFATHYFDGVYPTPEVTKRYLQKVEAARTEGTAYQKPV